MLCNVAGELKQTFRCNGNSGRVIHIRLGADNCEEIFHKVLSICFMPETTQYHSQMTFSILYNRIHYTDNITVLRLIFLSYTAFINLLPISHWSVGQPTIFVHVTERPLSRLHSHFTEILSYSSSAVTVSIFGFAVGFLIKTAIHGSVSTVPDFNHVQTPTILAKTPAQRRCKTATSYTADAVDATDS